MKGDDFVSGICAWADKCTFTQAEMEGKVTYYLNNESTADDVVWRQNVEYGTAEDAPVICITEEDKANHAIVYAYLDCWGNKKWDSYTNNPEAANGHTYGEDGVCTICGYDKSGRKTITTVDDLCKFSYNVNNGLIEDAILDADLDLSGNSTWQECGPIGAQDTYPFTGTFSGCGHTITLSSGAEGDPQNLFGAIKDAYITGLHITGTVEATKPYAASLVNYVCGETSGIYSCSSDLEIDSQLSGDGSHAGFVAVNESKTLRITNCLYSGTIQLNTNTKWCAGFVGFCKDSCTVEVSNSLMSGSLKNMLSSDDQSSVFVRLGTGTGKVTLNTCYYLNAQGITQGIQITADELKSGNVTYRLNDMHPAATNFWRQNLDNGKTVDTAPVVCPTDDEKSDHGIVYEVSLSSGEKAYSNTNPNASAAGIYDVSATSGSSAARKIIRSGRLVIVTPQGKTYNADGSVCE